jgi:hypothetical protein
MLAALAGAFVLSGCGTINSWVGEATADNLPQWMGGLPSDAPPRPSDPRYAEYEKAQKAKLTAQAPPGEAAQVDETKK